MGDQSDDSLGKKRKRTTRSSSRKSKAASQNSEGDLVIDESDQLLNPVKKRAGGIRLADEPVSITCTWQDCSEHFTDYIKYIHHGEDHALSVEGNDTGEYPCAYLGCTHQATHSIYLAKHVAFHVYHDRLKNVGNNVLSRVDLPKCNEGLNFEIPTVDYDYQCKWSPCTYISGTLHEYIAHIQEHIRDIPPKTTHYYCKWTLCTGKFNTQAKLSEHVRSHTKEKMIACPTCGTMFASKTKFIDHRKRQIPMEMHSFQCSECYKLFATERLLRDHIRLHINHYKCSLCDMTTHKRTELARHIRIRHLDERNYKCTLCEQACVSKFSLEQHLVTHCADKLMACEECDFRCRSVYGLDRHYQLVHGQGTESVYECHCCKKTFHRGAILSQHLMENHGFSWPSGHSRFRYKVGRDGIYRLNTVRYESLEVSQEDSICAPPIDKKIKYDIKKKSITKDGIISFELAINPESVKPEEDSRNSEDVDNPSEIENCYKEGMEVDLGSLNHIEEMEDCENGDTSSLKLQIEEESDNGDLSMMQLNDVEERFEFNDTYKESTNELKEKINLAQDIDDAINELEDINDADSDEDPDYINEKSNADDDNFYECAEDGNDRLAQVSDIIITINDVDERGNIIKSEIINSSEIVDFQY